MRTRTIITTLTLVAATILNAAAPTNGQITIKTGKASRQLVKSWISAYNEIHPEVNLTIVTTGKDADLTFTSNAEKDGTVDLSITNVARYAILPVTSTSNPLLSDIEKKNWSVRDLRKFYFTSLDDDFAEDDDEETSGKAGKLREKLTVYSGANAGSSASFFAAYFGYRLSELRGNKIAGDDVYLLNAIEEDTQSITYGQLAYLYDIQSRALKEGLAIIPVNTKKGVNEAIQSGNLDNVLSVLEDNVSAAIPVGQLSVTYGSINPAAVDFLKWVTSDGQQFNHKYGFLKLKDIESNDLAQK